MIFELHNGDCVEAMRKMPEASVGAVVTDPPYGLEFMGKEWDKLDSQRGGNPNWKPSKPHVSTGERGVQYGAPKKMPRCRRCGKLKIGNGACICAVPDWDTRHAEQGFRMQAWHERWAREVYRVLKPGGYLLAFGGTRTYHRMVCAIEDAGFEIRDSIDWIYGCLSEDTEILVDGQWEPYHKALTGRLALCYDVEYDEFSWQPIEDLYVYEYDDTAFHIVSDSTDQIVSRNHRCIIERDGRWVFAKAEAWEREESVPILEDLPSLLCNLSMLHKGASSKESVLSGNMLDKKAEKEEAIIGTQGPNGDVRSLRKESMEDGCASSQSAKSDMFLQVRRSSARPGVGQACTQGARCVDGGSGKIIQGKNERVEQPSVEGRRDAFPQTRELQTDQVREMPRRISDNGTKRRLCDGASSSGCADNGQAAFTHGNCASRKPRSTRQSVEESGTFRQQQRSQTVRGARYTRTDMARIEPFHYIGKVWCVRVSTGAFVARRNGKVFVTGNSGFPKSLDIGKAIDKAAGAEREVVGQRRGQGSIPNDRGEWGLKANEPVNVTEPATDAAKQWDGWGTALKPAHEPIVVARKPLIGTVAANVQEHGTGGINVDGCRVGTDKVCINTWDDGAKPFGGGAGHEYTGRESTGRWPPNVLLTHSERCRPIGKRKVKGDNRGDCHGQRPGGFGDVGAESGDAEPNAPVYGDDEIEAWVCVEGCPVVEMDRQSGELIPCGGTKKTTHDSGMFGIGTPGYSYTDKGGASRFFPCFKYQAKPSRAEKEAGCEHLEGGNNHPTIKSIDLMRWLVRLVTPLGGVVLDPFMGSGTTGIACHKERFGFIGIELDKDYFKIAEARIAAARAQLRLF